MMEDGTVASSVVESSSHGIDETTKDDSKEEKHQSHTSYDGVEVELSNEKERAVSIGNDEPNDVMIKSNEEVETGGHQYSSGFTSEIFKIEIRNIPPYIGFQQMRKKLNTLSLKPVKVKLLPQQSYCFVTFKNEEDRQLAISKINGLVWKNRTLKAHYSKPSRDPITGKRKYTQCDEEEDTEVETKKFCKEILSPAEINERLIEAVTPLWQIPYSEQLEMKTVKVKSYLEKAAGIIRRTRPGAWFDDHVTKNDGLLCQLLPIKPSPVLEGYRNKCEFTIGYGSDNEPVVGFRLGSYQDGDVTVAPPSSCSNVPNWTKSLVQVIDKHIKDSSFAPFNVRNFSGHWKQVLVRYFSTEESLVVVQFHKQHLQKEVVDEEKHKLTRLLEDSQVCPTSVYWQTSDEHRNKKPNYEHLLGKNCVNEVIFGMKFRVSPDSFFQVNTPASEVLYNVISDNITAASHTLPVLYDLCCGTGTIGIIVAKMLGVSKLVGIELSQQAIDDAVYNAECNGITNAHFIVGKVEDVLPSLVASDTAASGETSIAIVDPPRGGLHQKVIQAIRKSNINTLIYVSCNPEGTCNNFTDLCRGRSNRIKGLPFRPVSAVPVDLFPHTTHCELVVLFQRTDQTPVTGDTTTND